MNRIKTFINDLMDFYADYFHHIYHAYPVIPGRICGQAGQARPARFFRKMFQTWNAPSASAGVRTVPF